MFSNSILSVLLGYFITSSVGIEAFLIAPTRNIISTNRNTSGANGKTRPISGMEFVTSPFLSNQQSRFHRLFSTQSEEEYDISEGSESKAKISNLEKAWRHVKKPLLRIGSKGASKSHGNSLRELLSQHSVIKVKVNPGKYDSLEDAYESLKQLAEESGASPGIELLKVRDSQNVILFGQPGMLDKIERGEFPPSS